jgi:hypothetical protein
MSAANTENTARKGLVWIIGGLGALLIAALLIVKIWFAASVFAPIEDPAVTEPLDPEEQVVRDMVTPVTPGTPVMPDAEPTLDPSDYSRGLTSFIPIEVGMNRYIAKDELLLYYNSDPDTADVRAKVSSNETMIDGATLYVIRRSGMADDSVAAEETYAVFDNDVVVDFGTRIQCWRGENANQWTTKLCP